jgi:hypothetical protein
MLGFVQPSLGFVQPSFQERPNLGTAVHSGTYLIRGRCRRSRQQHSPAISTNMQGPPPPWASDGLRGARHGSGVALPKAGYP